MQLLSNFSAFGSSGGNLAPLFLNSSLIRRLSSAFSLKMKAIVNNIACEDAQYLC